MSKANKKRKALPRFQSEEAERDFWAEEDSADYIDWQSAYRNPEFPHLKPTTRSVSIRLPEWLLGELRELASKHDVPYQSLMKLMLIEQVRRRRQIRKRK